MTILYPGQLNRALTCAELDNNFAKFIDRSNHVGTQPASTISDLEDTIKTFNTIVDLKSCCIDLTQRIELIETTVDINTILNQFQSQYDDFVNNIDIALSNSALINGLSADIINVQSNISILFTTGNNLQSQIDAANSEIDTIQGELVAINGSESSLSTRLDTAESEIDALQIITGGNVEDLFELNTVGLIVRTTTGLVTRAVEVESFDLTLVNSDGTAGNINLELSNTGVTAGTYNQARITVDEKGRIRTIEEGSSINEVAVIYSDATGSFSYNTWTTYPLTRVIQTSNFVTLDTVNNTFSLTEGTYFISIYCAPFVDHDGNYTYRLYNVDQSIVQQDISNFDVISPNILVGTLNSNTDFRVPGNVESIIDSNGAAVIRLEVNGIANDGISFGGSRSAQISIRKLS